MVISWQYKNPVVTSNTLVIWRFISMLLFFRLVPTADFSTGKKKKRVMVLFFLFFPYIISTIYGRDFGSNFLNGDFDVFIGFVVPYIQKSHF